MIKAIPKFDGGMFVEETRSFNDILQMTWPFLSKMVSGLERPESIPRESIKGVENTSDLDDNESSPGEVSAHGSRNSYKGPHNRDDVKTLDTANETIFSILRLTTTGAARGVLLKFEPRHGQPGNGRQAWLSLKNK